MFVMDDIINILMPYNMSMMVLCYFNTLYFVNDHIISNSNTLHFVHDDIITNLNTLYFVNDDIKICITYSTHYVWSMMTLLPILNTLPFINDDIITVQKRILVMFVRKNICAFENIC